MIRIATGFTLAGIALGLLVLIMLSTGLAGTSQQSNGSLAYAQAVETPVTYTMESGQVVEVDPENALVISLRDGDVVIQMLPDFAPNHVARIKELARSGFYDSIVWHRVIDGFMAQTGDPLGQGIGGSGQKLNEEFNQIPFLRGIVGMARSRDVNSADSQFFIMFDEGRFLDGQYTAWGRVVSGMEFVDMIKKGDQASNGSVTDPDKMIKVSVLADTL